MEASKQIPSDWVRKVCDTLDMRKKGSYRITIRARQDFEALFPDLFSEEMLSLMADVLRNGKYTDFRNVVGFDPEGNAYEFLFPFRDRRMYGKINLKDRMVFVRLFLLIFSKRMTLKTVGSYENQNNQTEDSDSR